ncbi:unnamed protein product [Schistosoma margrebowiei]|uniref:Uncharacterized protein n=1 Tax=Schistosoma margrebowiei TaxID=48269 RepID=A0A183MDW1_9TREM|nr:unnamed protein product [Schistosoma margrebowiei]
MLAFQRQQNQQMLALQQQLFETVLSRICIKAENKKSIYHPDNGAVMDISEAYPVQDSNPFIPEGKRNIDDQEPDPVDEAQSPELNETLLVLSSSENKLQLEQNRGPCAISRESYGDSYSENNWSNTMNPIVPEVTQNHRKTEFYIESTYPISNDNVPDIDSQNNAYNFDETSYNNEGNMSAESNDGQKSNLILFDIDFLNDSLSANEIHNEFENNELTSKVVHYHLVIFSGFSSQYEKHGLNKVLLDVIWSHKDPTLFRGGGECWGIQRYT